MLSTFYGCWLLLIRCDIILGISPVSTITIIRIVIIVYVCRPCPGVGGASIYGMPISVPLLSSQLTETRTGATLRGRWHAEECVVKYPRVGVPATHAYDKELGRRICNQDPYFVVVEWLTHIYESLELFSPFVNVFGRNNLLAFQGDVVLRPAASSTTTL